MTQTIVEVLAYASNEKTAGQLHQIAHCDGIETIMLEREDTLRHRLRVSSDRGNEYLIALPREQQISDGAVLMMSADHALVVRMAEEQWLRLEAIDKASAVELGYFAGNLHWRVKFKEAELHVALEGPESDYLKRLEPLLRTRRVRQITEK